MAKIKFENGITVNFEGNPTQADIDEVWNQVKDSKPSAPPVEKKSALSKGLSAIGGTLKGAGGKIAEQLGSLSGAKDYIEKSIAETSPARAFTKPAEQLWGLTAGLGKMLGKTAMDVGSAAVGTVRDYSTAVKTAGAATGQLLRGGKLSDEFQTPSRFTTISSEQQQQLRDTTGNQRKAVEGVANFIPTPSAQFATGLSQGQREGIEKGLPVSEATGRGLVSGTERYVVMKVLQKLAKKKTEQQKIVEEKISPKLTAKTKEQIVKEGLVSQPKQGKLSKLLFGEKAPTVEASKRIKQAAKTVKSQIKNADKLDDFTLQQKIDAKVGTVAKDLSPKLKKIELSKDAVPKIKSEWNTLKNKQAADFNALDYKTGTMQKDFGKVLEKATSSIRDASGKFRYKNMDDIWDIAKGYDKSIPSSIKDALPNSGLAWAKRQAWIENRNLLRDFIKSNSGEAKEAFGIMHDLMTASENIVERGFSTKATSGLLRPRNLAIGAGALVAGKIGLGRLGNLPAGE